MNKNNFTSRMFIGTIFIVGGVFYMLCNLGIIPDDWTDYIFNIPSLIMFIGVLRLLSSRGKMLGVLLFLMGAFLYLPIIIPGLRIHDFILPLVFIFAGFYMILRQRHGVSCQAETENDKTTDCNPRVSLFSKSNDTTNRDKIDEIAIFGGGQKFIKCDSFKGGNITAVFGGCEIDLTESSMAEGEQVLDVLALFGGIEVKVPKEWNVIIDVTPIFGGFSVKGRRDNEIIDKNKTLIIKGVVIFGGGEIKFN